MMNRIYSNPATNGPIQLVPSTYMFVDWGYVKREYNDLIQRLFPDANEDFDFKKLFKLVTKSPDKIFIFDATKDEQSQADNPDYAKIQEIPYCHLMLGFTKGNNKRVRQKGVDTSLAVEMIKHYHNGNYSRAILFAGDLDFHPLTSYLVDIGADVILLYRPSSTSKDLINSVDRAIELTDKRLYGLSSDIFIRTNPFETNIIQGPISI